MRLTFFGRLRDAVGVGELDCSPPANVEDSESFRAWIGAAHPALLDAKVRMAIDDVLISEPTSIVGASDIAFLPPVSGG